MSKRLIEAADSVTVDWSTGAICGESIVESHKTIGDLVGLFLDEGARGAMDPASPVYSVRAWLPVSEGTTGGLFWGVTTLRSGRVGDEYYMTHGHFHTIRDRAEFYATVKGKGILLLMREDGFTFTEEMKPGSLNYIPGCIAHRAVNTGEEPLVFLASWPADAGHDYEIIRKKGFSKRVVLRNGAPCVL
jgi:glucose-6-phosphate isomerase, archaeal